MKSIKYDKEEFQDLVNSVTPLQAVEWLLMNGYPIQVRNLGKSTVDILCPSPDHNDTNFGNCKISTNRYDGSSKVQFFTRLKLGYVARPNNSLVSLATGSFFFFIFFED